ncbi:MAG: prolipoprotein diacylglyceryl transferase [Bacteroidia bacterium]
MYPRISDIFNDLFGWNIILPIQSFGFFVALAFIAAYFLLQADLKRKQSLGYFQTRKVKVTRGGPIKETEILINFLLFGILGYKLGLMVEDYSAFAHNPQEAILSLKGSLPWGLLLAFAGGGYKFYEFWKKRNDKTETVEEEHGILQELGTVLTIAFVAGILGAKIFHNLEYIDDFMADPIGSLFSFSGLTFYGGLICAGVGIGWYIVKKGYPLLPFADSVAPALMLAYGIGRIGCQTAGDGDWGIDNMAPKPDWMGGLPDWMWAYTYPHNVLNQGIPIEGCTGDYCHALEVPVFPTPFYEIIMALIIFAGLWMIRKRLPYWGQLSGIYLFFNGVERFLIEKIRVNSTYDIFGFEITQAEIISALLMIFGIVLFYFATVKWKKQAKAAKKIS